jgi:branched-chain amino acid transport system ATP-binding protein
MLAVHELRAGYGAGTVLHGVSFEVTAGGVHAVLGRNGAGKTTLLHTIAGLHRPTGGRIVFDGCDITGWPAHRRTRAGLALVPQGRRVFASLTVAEHLAIAHRPHDRRRTRRHGDAGHPGDHPVGVWTPARVLDQLPALAARLRHRGRQLSGGEQQMLAIARALLTRPRLLLLDEPTEGLAPQIAAQVQQLIDRLAAGGLTVLLATPVPPPAAPGGVTELSTGAVP